MTLVGVGTSLFLIVMITFDNYDHFFCSGLRPGSTAMTHPMNQAESFMRNRPRNPDKVRDMQLQTGARKTR